MTAPINQAAFTVARPAVVERFLIDGNAQPSSLDQVVSDVKALPIAYQIEVFRRVMDSAAWAEMMHLDYDRVEAALSQFADEVEDAADEEDVRLHGRDDNTPSYWL